jgi:hypothetical protein
MTDTPDPPTPVEEFVHRAERIAAQIGGDAEHHVPSWLRPGSPESRLPVLLAIVAAIVLQRAIPAPYTVVPRWPLVALELLLLIVLLVINPVRLSRRTTVGKWASLGLTAAITIDNTTSAIVLDYRILSGEVSNDPKTLLGSGAAIFITNVIAFGIWYWELDRGGPFARVDGDKPYPDFLFPQMSDPTNSKPGWRPTFVDYLYVSFTNVVAFSPTDTMPLSRWAKLMMTVQSLVALSTLGLVFARAVNVLG